VVKASEILNFLRAAVRKNAGLKVLALAMAVVLWWFVAGESKVQIGFVIPIEIRNLPRGLAIANKVQREVEVRVTGPPSLLGNMTPSEISAAIDLSDARAGRISVPIVPDSVKVPSGIKVQRVYPGAVEVDLQKLERRRLPVDARLPAHLRKKIGRIEVDPPQLEVEGLAGDFEFVRRLQTEEIVPPAYAAGLFRANARVELRDGHAKIVGSPTVRVTVHFRKQGSP
jgi:YbbR domain-containing protein